MSFGSYINIDFSCDAKKFELKDSKVWHEPICTRVLDLVMIVNQSPSCLALCFRLDG